jgi:branched-chain amino acid aminotransferase
MKALRLELPQDAAGRRKPEGAAGPDPDLTPEGPPDRVLTLERPTNPVFTLEALEAWIEDLRVRNGLHGECRARLTVFRAGDGLYNTPDSRAAFCIHVGPVSTPARGAGGLSTRSRGTGGRSMGGLTLDVYPDGRKPCDALSAIKSNNYLLSSLAGMYVKDRGLDDCVLLNLHDRVAETASANIWWVRGERIFTPPLSEGCVAGVMRRFLLAALPRAGFAVGEAPIDVAELETAEECWITNAVKGLESVSVFRGARYGIGLAAAIRQELIEKL